MAYNKERQLRDNINAIHLALRLGVEHRGARNAGEREILQRYGGFGGLKFILNDATEFADASKWSKADAPYFGATLELNQLIHDYSRDEKEYRRYMDSLKTSVLTAFYTDSRITDTLADSLRDRGVSINSFLEPSAGQGAFLDSFINRNPGTEALAFEKDLLTGKILAALHPSVYTQIEGFEKIAPARLPNTIRNMMHRRVRSSYSLTLVLTSPASGTYIQKSRGNSSRTTAYRPMRYGSFRSGNIELARMFVNRVAI